MTSAQIRQSFLDFFAARQHTVVQSSSLMPDSPNLLFTNAGMNQFVPIFLGEKKCVYVPARAADTQKCIRAGGKHNDLDDVGFDTYHHTFFEMLGNWSFGDYFKKEAIGWAWELVTGVWKFPVNRLYATVYRPGEGEPAEADEEARDAWRALFAAAGADPDIHVIYSGKKDNFWMMGETGPCGPCSELHVDLTAAGDTKGALVNKGSSECIEIWNLVFIQFNANPDGTFAPLPACHVDTGMGFERVTAIVQGTEGFTDFRRSVSNYDTDIFRPIFEKISQLSGKVYTGSLPEENAPQQAGGQAQIDVAFRVIADHIRTLSFAIADGIMPGNTDRHYVLRRILRRAVSYGRKLGMREPFFFKLVGVLAETMGDVFPEIRMRRQLVEEVIFLEEEAFNRTLDKGIALFAAEADRCEGEISGEFAFWLYDTSGFPLDLTQILARERNLTVDVEGFERLMEEQRRRARSAQKKEVIELSQIDSGDATVFCGYDEEEANACVREVIQVKGRMAVVFDLSPCYAEMGGQLGDCGIFSGGGRQWRIVDTRKAGEVWLHFLEGDDAPEVGLEVVVRVDAKRRAAISRHHTVTHLLHWALHEVVGAEVSQKGSYVGPEKLTFDFNSAPLTEIQREEVQRLVNEKILENAVVSWTEVDYEGIKKRGDVQQFFGDKYGDRVRVVQIGGRAGALDGYSMELCGGTHVRGTGEIGQFRLLAESAIAAGTRRIEAVAGFEALSCGVRDGKRLDELARKAGAPVHDLEKKVETLVATAKQLEKQLVAFRQKQAAEVAKQLLGEREMVGEVPLISAQMDGFDGEDLQQIAFAAKKGFEGVMVLAGRAEGKVHLVCQVTGGWTSKFAAGKILQAIAPLVGGRGGGKPDFARGAGTNADGVEAALSKAREILAGG